MNNFFYDLNKRMAALADKQDLHESKVAESEKWIQKAVNPKHKGDLHKALHVAQDKKIPKAKIEKATHSKNPKLRHMAQFAKNVAHEGQEMANEGYGDADSLLSKIRANNPDVKGEFAKSRARHDAEMALDFERRYRDQDINLAKKEQPGRVRPKISGYHTGDVEEHIDPDTGKTAYVIDKDGKKRYMKSANPLTAKEGNAFTGALAKTPKGGKFKVGGKEFKDTSDLEEGFKEMDAWLAQREKEKGTGKFDRKERTLPSGMKATTYTRRHDDEEDSDTEVKSDEPKKKGRPKGKDKGPERVTAKSYKYKAGRPAKTQEALDSDGVMMTRSTNCSSESIEHGEQAEYNDEAGMTKDSLHTIVRHARELERALRDNENLPEWVQEKIGQIKGMMSSVTDYIISTHERDVEQHMEPVAEDSNLGDYRLTLTGPQAAILLTALIGSPESKYYKKYVHPITAQLIGQGVTAGYDKRTLKRFGPSQQDVAEKAVSKAQRKFMGMAHAIQKGEKIKGASPELKKVAKTMKPTDTHDFAVTKEKGLPKKVKKTEEGAKPDFLDVDKDGNKKETFKKAVADKKDKKEDKVDETTVAGSVAPVQNAASKAKGGMQFGKGVYEGMDKKFNQALTESINIESAMEECGDGQGQGITIRADGDDAAKLMQLLKLAGLGQSTCPTCGSAPCGCEELEENAPDWPTNTETLAADPELRTYSGGLNGPKSTGQTTVPVVASQLRRQASMEESVELERTLFKTWKNYKG